MDYHADNTTVIRELKREVARLRAEQSQFFSRYAAQIAHRQNPRLAKTVADEQADPTYPIQGIGGGNTFPIVFLSAGFTNAAGANNIEAVPHRTTPQAFVRIVSGNWVPQGVTLQVWQDRGTNGTYKGEWFSSYSDRVRLGVTSGAIAKDANGTVREWNTATYSAESDASDDWLCRNWCGYDLEANTRVFFTQIGSVAYILNAACEPEPSGSGA